jgi:hypothetical protein
VNTVSVSAKYFKNLIMNFIIEPEAGRKMSDGFTMAFSKFSYQWNEGHG